jgi:carbamoylphosphate synthase large subunit
MSVLITSIGSAPASAIARSLNDNYNIIGIDMKDLCVGNFICKTFISIKEKINSDIYWNKIIEIIIKNNIKFVFVSLPFEAKEWSLRKYEFMQKYECKILLNDVEFCEITNNKEKTYNFCIENNINIPLKLSINDRPIVIKEIEGCGSANIQILKLHEEIAIPFNANKFIIQKFIYGDEFTVDVISDPNGNVINVIPKKRCFVKNGQSFISKICNNMDIINFVTDVCVKLKNKCAINVQVIKEKDKNNIYLI